MSYEYDCFDSCVRLAIKEIKLLDIDEKLKSMIIEFLVMLDY